MKVHQALIFIFAVAAIDSCLSYTEQQDEQLQCADKMTKCVEDFRRAYFGRKYAEALKEHALATQCLNSLTCSLPEFLNYLQDEELGLFEAEYKSGILTGKCNYNAAEKCNLIAHGINVDDYPDKREEVYYLNYNYNYNQYYDKPCSKGKIQAGRHCMLAIKLHCVSQKQVDLYKNTMAKIDAAICYTGR